jgi:predicted nucleotidyltransferase
MKFHGETTRQKAIIDRLCRLLKEDDRVLATWLVGSLAQGSGDRFSDIDMYIVPSNAAYDAVYNEREDIARSLANLSDAWSDPPKRCGARSVLLPIGTV